MSRGFSVEYAPEALDDLRAIYTYIAFHLGERETAARQVGRIRREIQALGKMPERWPSVDWAPWSSLGMRKLTVDRYVVYYLVNQRAGRVSVVRIFYGGRDVETIINGEE